MSACATGRQADTAPSLKLAEKETPQLFSYRSAVAVGEQIRRCESAALDSSSAAAKAKRLKDFVEHLGLINTMASAKSAFCECCPGVFAEDRARSVDALVDAVVEDCAVGFLNVAVNAGGQFWQACEMAAAKVKGQKLYEQMADDAEPDNDAMKAIIVVMSGVGITCKERSLNHGISVIRSPYKLRPSPSQLLSTRCADQRKREPMGIFS